MPTPLGRYEAGLPEPHRVLRRGSCSRCCSLFSRALCLLAQGKAPAADADKQTIQMLLQRIERFESRGWSNWKGRRRRERWGQDSS